MYFSAFTAKAPAGDFKMVVDIECELAELNRAITERQRHVEDKSILIEVLERDGYDVSDQELALKQDRSELAILILRQFELLKTSSQPAE